ncbi:major facilitator superfamily domain-containing protein [Neurospora tetraspora]|uniref:Major facilitator superfamily domain-containing protein n=1 Tax=Neurospora tetraspora TaxID=94610 RepID=A0AAE0MVR0_9PEZI|nr:major facilitator superfamily domain-containing protein [Neurospora tetraspora]
MWSRTVETNLEEGKPPENTTDQEPQQQYFRFSPPTDHRGTISGEECCSLASSSSSSSSVLSKIEDIEDSSDYPNGGLLAWSQVLVAMLVNMLAWGYPATFGVYQLYYVDTLRLPSSQVSWIGSAQTFLALATCTLSGRLADAGHIKWTMTAGCGMVVFGTFMTSLCGGGEPGENDKYWQIFLAQGICTGFGLGICFMPPLSVVNSYFSKEKRSFALAVSATGTGLGSIVFPAIIQYLTPKFGFAWAVRCQAFVALMISVIAVALVRPRLEPRRSGPLVEWKAFKEVPYRLFVVGAFLFFYAIFFGFFFINVYARNIVHFPTTSSVHLLIIANGVSVLGRPLAGYIADRHIGAINTFCIGTCILSVVLFSWMGVHTRAGMYVFSAFLGLSTGAAQGIYNGAMSNLTKDPRRFGTRFGMINTTVAFAALAGPPTAGAIIDHDGGRYKWAQVWAGTVVLHASMIFMAVRISISGWKLKMKV